MDLTDENTDRVISIYLMKGWNVLFINVFQINFNFIYVEKN